MTRSLPSKHKLYENYSASFIPQPCYWSLHFLSSIPSHLFPPFLSPSFLDVQAAWDTLRHPTTRDAYDQQLQRQQREEQGGGFVADEVKVDEMDEEGGSTGRVGGWCTHADAGTVSE